MNWYKITLNSDQIIGNEEWKISDRFMKACLQNRFPRTLGMFAARGNDHSQSVFYFSPAVQDYCPNLIADYNGVACERPSASEVRSEFGNASPVELLAD